MIIKFGEWLVTQQHRKDLIGDLARIPSLQTINHAIPKRKPDEHKSWADIVIRIAEPGYITVFNEAWQEFLLARQAAQGFPD